MAIGEVFLGAFLQVLFDRLASRPLLEFLSQFRGLRSKVEEWKKKLRIIEAVLIDAEEKQMTDRAKKMWLDDLQHLAYDTEDVLDEFATKAMERQLMAKNNDHAVKSCRCKYRNLIPSCFTGFKFNRDMLSKIDDISSRLDRLCTLKNELELVKTSGVLASSPMTSSPQRPPSTSLPSALDVVGRDEDKSKILDMVLKDEDTHSNIQVVPIVGMGGIGKTTLIQVVYNDASVSKKFDIKAWVCISQYFDVPKISKAILKDITSSSCDSLDFNQVQRKLQDEVADKKFLIVLDDVWSAKYSLWQNLMSPFKNGAHGGKIILTTRNEDVAKILGSQNYHQLNPLSDDSCWSIFKNCILENRQDDANTNLEAFHKNVIERCRGLPLAAQSLGSLLRSKEICEWEHILDEKIWEELESNQDDDVLPVLRLSYRHLPLHLKRCFAYCALFPEDCELEMEELVRLWMAEGLVPESRGNQQMEDLGREYFHDLASRSFFQPSGNNSSKYTMHDFINKLACSTSGEEVSRPNKQPKSFERTRRFSYITDGIEGNDKYEILRQALHLRTFLPLNVSGFDCNYISNGVVSHLLPKMQKLRVLSLKDYYVNAVPDSIRDLRHLRYLNLANTRVRSLPESTSSLINLQTLDLRNCSQLMKLPSKMKELVNLRYLNIKGARLISEMPIGMRELQSLRYLSNFIIGKGRGSGLEDLKHLKLLGGELCVSGLENVNDVEEAILSEMKDLQALILEWKFGLDDQSRDEKMEKKSP